MAHTIETIFLINNVTKKHGFSILYDNNLFIGLIGKSLQDFTFPFET